jgi:hypothetical protein
VYQWDRSVVARYDLTSLQWDQHDVPYSCRLFLAAGQLYLSVSNYGISNESGIALYEPKTGNTTLLASSRRRPPQNQFDNCSFYNVSDIFTGPGNQACTAIDTGGTYVIGSSPGNWPPMVDSGEMLYTQSDGTRTIIYGARDYANIALGDVVFMIDPVKKQPELLLGEPAQMMGMKMEMVAVGSPPAPWPTPPVWPASPTGDHSSPEYGFRGDDIYARFSNVQTLKDGLLWYRRGQPRPLYIPLEFKLNDDAAAVFKKIQDAEPVATQQYLQKPIEGGEMKMGNTGIFFIEHRLGFYFLPYADIDAYLKTHPDGVPAEEPQIPAPRRAPRPGLPYFGIPHP